MALFKKSLFSDEIQAWDFGPVVPAVYKVYSKYGNTSLPETDKAELSDTELQIFLKEVWKVFGKYSASELVNISHQHDPWKKHYSQNAKNRIIPREEMMQFYQKLFKVNVQTP